MFQKFACVLTISMSTTLALASEPISNTDVFINGADGYSWYRVPAIEVTQKGNLLAFSEGNVHGAGECGDTGADVDLVYRRSIDNGQTWSKLRVIEDPGAYWAASNPETLVDRFTGRIWLFYLRCKPGATTYRARPGTDDAQFLARTSDDDGITWSAPIDLTKISRDFKDQHWGISVPGPGNTIQLRSGRLLVPVWKYAPFKNFAIYSDDHGKSWHRSAEVPGSEQGDESGLIELADGRILMDIRQNDATNPMSPARYRSISSDGGATWSPYEKGPLIVTPVACAIARFSSVAAGDDKNRILWTGPRGPERRTNLVMRVSYDEGQTFTNEHLIGEGRAVYSDISILKDKSIGVFWEHGNYMVFSRFGLDFLEQP